VFGDSLSVGLRLECRIFTIIATLAVYNDDEATKVLG
jgi:hypothetical protein